MKPFFLFLFLIFAIAGLAFSDSHDCASMKDHKNCPYMKNGHKEMNERGDTVMGFSQDKTTHHFLITADGGQIVVEAKEPKDQESVKQIQKHLEVVAQEFTDGDFDMPHAVHLQTPPGADVMIALKTKIDYKYEESPVGAKVVISTKDPKALTAIHDFLKFQIEEHQTGDPLAVQ
jgi:hypothetical protein